MDVSDLDAPPTDVSGAPAQTTDDLVGTTDFNDSTITQFKFDSYKGRKATVDRIAILNVRDLPVARTHYLGQGKGYVLCASKYKKVGNTEVLERAGVCCQKGDEPKKRFAILIVQYATDPAGKLVNPLSYSMKLWRVSEDKYVQLRDIHAEFPLDAHDLVIRCTEESFQKMTIQAARESIIRLEKFPAKDKAEIAAWAAGMKADAKKALGRRLNDTEMLERFGLAAAARPVSNEQVVGNLDDLLPPS